MEFLLSNGANCAVLPSLHTYEAIGLSDKIFSMLVQAKEKERVSLVVDFVSSHSKLTFSTQKKYQDTYEEIVFSLEKGENFFANSVSVTVKYGEIKMKIKAPKKNLTERNLLLWNEVLRLVWHL